MGCCYTALLCLVCCCTKCFSPLWSMLTAISIYANVTCSCQLTLTLWVCTTPHGGLLQQCVGPPGPVVIIRARLRDCLLQDLKAGWALTWECRCNNHLQYKRLSQPYVITDINKSCFRVHWHRARSQHIVCLWALCHADSDAPELVLNTAGVLLISSDTHSQPPMT